MKQTPKNAKPKAPKRERLLVTLDPAKLKALDIMATDKGVTRAVLVQLAVAKLLETGL